LALLLLSTAFGCAYFNTFYNAREHFKKAERMRGEQHGQETVSASAIQEYDLTIEKCNKVIQRHSKSRWVDDAILLMGRAYLGKQQYVEALDKFRALVDGFGKSNLRYDALFLMGVTYFRLARHEEGRQAFERLTRERPGFERLDEAMAVQARALVDAGDVAGAARMYRRILDEYPESDARVETLFDIGELYMRDARFDSAYAVYDEAMRTATSMDQRLEARRYRADALHREGRAEEALETYREVLDLGASLTADEKAAVALKIAACLSDLGDQAGAIRDYDRVIETYPGTPFAAEAGYQKGYIHEIYQGDYVKALEVYEAVRAMGGQAVRSIFAEQAEARAQKLRRLAEIGITSAESKAAEGGEAEGAFLLAEHFFFDEGDTAKSYAQYALVEREYPESGYAARAAYARAWLMARNPSAVDSTIGLFVAVLERYPGTPQALQAGDYLTAHGRADLIPEGALVVPAAVDSAEASRGRPAEGGAMSESAAADSAGVAERAAPDSAATYRAAAGDRAADSLSTTGLLQSGRPVGEAREEAAPPPEVVRPAGVRDSTESPREEPPPDSLGILDSLPGVADPGAGADSTGEPDSAAVAPGAPANEEAP
jgi:TolA-binding protein